MKDSEQYKHRGVPGLESARAISSARPEAPSRGRGAGCAACADSLGEWGERQERERDSLSPTPRGRPGRTRHLGTPARGVATRVERTV